MKAIEKKTDMKHIYTVKLVIVLAVSTLLGSCKDYLDIVPDKTQELELLFDRKQQAFKALATCYSYLPKDDDLYATHVLSTDELTTPIRQVTNGIEIMRGKQNANDPLLNLWHGYNGGEYQGSIYRAISDCNILIDNIDLVPDMTVEEKETWKAEATFLKAYYHFLLARVYGPIPIMDKNLPISASVEEMRVSRSPFDECVEYITNTIDKAVADLPTRVTNNLYLGRIDKTIALSIKARVLLYAASPLFNGNGEFYGNLKNEDGTPLFNLTADTEKWKKALDAADAALTMALENGVTIYLFDDAVPTYDFSDYTNEEIQSMYNYRYMFTDKWNQELIWGHSKPITSWYQLQAASLVKNPAASSNEAAWQWLSPTLRMAELYYTKNGLPIDEDLEFDYENRHEIVTVSYDNRLEAQTAQQTANLHLNREPRFYASIGFDRGYSRSHGQKLRLRLRAGEKPGGRQGSSNDYLVSGYLLKKFTHPSSQGDTYDNLIKYPWPIIRLAELYLNYAEAYNEYHGPSQEVYDALNTVRARVGLPAIEEIWSDPTKAKSVDKHIVQDGLREIIHQERLIELAFEGHRNHDIRRWKQGAQYFNSPVMGWSVDETDIAKFYTLSNVGERVFITPRDYLHPIRLDEFNKNPNLVQNPGW
jgi:hypothetical protein